MHGEQLYGDSALSEALNIVLQLSLSIPVNELMAYPKVGVCASVRMRILTPLLPSPHSMTPPLAQFLRVLLVVFFLLS